MFKPIKNFYTVNTVFVLSIYVASSLFYWTKKEHYFSYTLEGEEIY